MNKYQVETKELLGKWEDKSREFIQSFLRRFTMTNSAIKAAAASASSSSSSASGASANGGASSSSGSGSGSSMSSAFSLTRLAHYRNKYLSALRQHRQLNKMTGSPEPIKRSLSDDDAKSDKPKRVRTSIAPTGTQSSGDESNDALVGKAPVGKFYPTSSDDSDDLDESNESIGTLIHWHRHRHRHRPIR